MSLRSMLTLDDRAEEHIDDGSRPDPTFAEALAKYWAHAEPLSGFGPLPDTDNAQALLMRMLRIAILTNAVVTSSNTAEYVSRYDALDDDLGGQSLWAAALHDQGCVEIVCNILRTRAPSIPPERLNVFQKFESLWNSPRMRCTRTMRIKAIFDLSSLLGSKIAAYCTISCRPTITSPSKTLYEAVLISRTPDLVIERELEALTDFHREAK